jgi:hypothetical protein
MAFDTVSGVLYLTTFRSLAWVNADSNAITKVKFLGDAVRSLCVMPTQQPLTNDPQAPDRAVDFVVLPLRLDALHRFGCTDDGPSMRGVPLELWSVEWMSGRRRRSSTRGTWAQSESEDPLDDDGNTDDSDGTWI